uniref:Apple domain-containing protein n=1 Tax=Tetradesmus obliquus TaxID=3088 RepID=A0A383VEC9_TETOB|eukprot:jgi/Sobl393_1/9947/SZX63551.1
MAPSGASVPGWSGVGRVQSLRSLHKLLYVYLFFFLLHRGSAVIQCTVESATVPQNIEGDVLVLAAGTLAYTGPHPSSPTLTSAAECANACGLLPGCNAWTFCSRQSGCGSGCSSWVAKHPKMPAGGPANRDPVEADLPILGFGPWTYPQTQNGCQYSFNTDSTSDAWPYGLCTLKRVPNTKKLKYVPPSKAAPQRTTGVVTESAAAAASADGWISGTLSVSEDCQGLPPNVCRLCGSSKHPDSCLKCAKDARGQFSSKPVNYLISKGSKAQNACAVCAGLADAKQKESCFDCILDNKRCSTCVYGARMWGYGKPDISACLSCAAKKGNRYVGACNACAQSSSPGRCFACLDTQPLKICNTTQRAGSDGCNIGPNDQTPCDLCSNAAQSDDVFKQCLACHTNPNVQQECLDCGNIPTTAATQARCYACVKAARFASYTSTGCAACFSSWLIPGKSQSCLQCVEASTTPFAAKASCSSCVDGSVKRSQALQDKCFGCLKKTQIADYAATCIDQSMRR